MLNFLFKKLYDDLSYRVKVEQKTDSSWLMGYLQGRGKKKLTGYQVAALVDLLLVHPVPPEEPAVAVPHQEEKPATAGNDIRKTFARKGKA